MGVPHFVRRAARRVLVWSAASAVIVAVVGIAGERLRFGANFAAARDRIERDIQGQFAALTADLDRVIDRVRREPSLMRTLSTREAAAVRELFGRLADAEATLNIRNAAVSVYGPEVRPLAWAGRPTQLPTERITGQDALFLAPSMAGPRLTRVMPIFDADPSRLATVVVEAPLSQAAVATTGDAFVMQTSVIPIPLRLTFESGPTVPEHAVIVRDASGLPLARADIPEAEVEGARHDWRRRVAAVEVVVLVAALLLLSGPLLDWRRLSSSIGGHVALTACIVALLVAARALAWYAVRLADLDAPALASRAEAGWFFVGLASPIDLLLTTLLIGAAVALAASSFEQWRHGRRVRVRIIPDAGALEMISFIVAQLLAGAAAAALIVGYEWFLRGWLALTPYDLLHFSLHPLDVLRFAVATALVILHASLLALAVLLFRMAIARWVIARDQRWIRGWIPVLWAAPALLVFIGATREWEQPPVVPMVAVLAVGMLAAWQLRRYRARLEHVSQASRLTAFFVALAVPSVVFYPSLVDASDRARRQIIEERFAPEVVDQRRNLQLQLDEALAQIEALPDLADLVQVGDPVVAGPVPFETAFRVWERTILEDLRLTSSIELHDEAGALASRFSLNLPQTGGPQPYQEETCEWELFEEVSPFFAEERRLLHAGRGICVDTPAGQQIVGSIAVHVTLDYSNLSFITAQSPYVALLRGEDFAASERSPRERVEFTVYGWSRRPLYVSGRDTWPLSEALFARIFSSREPFWARAAIGSEEYEVYFLNDRGGIYALGYRLTSPVGHMISVAELLVLSATTYVMMLLAGLVYGRIAARTPTSGRDLLREIRASFYRKLFIAFVAAAVVPVLALALVTRAYIARLMQSDLETEASRTAASASRVVEDVGLLELTGGTERGLVDDDLVVWLSRVIAQDVNIFDASGLLASSERSLFAYGLLPRSTQGNLYRAIVIEGRPSYVAREAVGLTEYLVAAAPVRVQNRQAILTVPLTLRQQEIESQVDELDRRVLLAAVFFIIVGAAIGYSMAERIADPVNRLMKATGRIARGDLNARILPTSSDEFRRLVEAFNRMAADLLRQRAELERSNRLAAWADMARQVAHDIKNPLTPIQLNAEHLRRVHEDRGAPLGRMLDECVNNILNQVRLLRQIAGEFSSFATSPTAKPVPESLAAVIAEVVEAYRTGLEGRVNIAVDLAPDLPRVLVDKVVLSRALTNIIENALHAMPAGGTLRITAQANGAQTIELAIADTGVGMDRAALDRIFEPYFSTRGSGTGLGLTIAKRNVELNGGSIAVESERGQGTIVRITLPTVPAAA